MDIDGSMESDPLLVILSNSELQKLAHTHSLLIQTMTKTALYPAPEDLSTSIDVYDHSYGSLFLGYESLFRILEIFLDERVHRFPTSWIDRFLDELLTVVHSLFYVSRITRVRTEDAGYGLSYYSKVCP